MDMSIPFVFFFYLLLSTADEGHATSWSVLSAETENVKQIYEGKTDVIPLQNMSNTLYVLLDLELLAINDFDDVKGIIDINTYLSMQWVEEIYFNAHGLCAPDTSVTISTASIWKPSLILVNSDGEGTEIIKVQSQVRIHLKSGKCELTENVVFKASCKPNVYLYPFDIHDCSVKLTTRAYTSSELTLIASSFRNDYFENSVSWSLRKTYAETLYQDSKSYAKFQIIIKRRSTNYVLNYLLPVAILSGLNPFVFILTRNSGERAGYSVTCFLAIVIFMNTVITPQQRGSILMYYLTGVMIISGVITLVVCLTLVINKMIDNNGENSGTCCCSFDSNRVGNISTTNQQVETFNNDGGNRKPPWCLQALAYCLFCMCCTCCTSCKCCMCRNKLKKLRWIHVANIFDIFFFVFFFAAEFTQFIVYIIIMAQQYSAEIEKL